MLFIVFFDYIFKLFQQTYILLQQEQNYNIQSVTYLIFIFSKIGNEINLHHSASKEDGEHKSNSHSASKPYSLFVSRACN